jgi:hypothetical protein
MSAREDEWQGLGGQATSSPAPTIYAASRPTEAHGDLGLIAGAFAKAQLEMQNPKFDAANPFYKSKFASLAAVRNAVVPLLAKNGICMAQDLITAEGTISCITILTHSSGQQMKFGPLTLPVAKADAQGYAAAGTYAKRIALQSVCGVVGDEDDDGNHGKDAPPPKTTSAEYTAGEGSQVPVDHARTHALAMMAIIQAPAKDGDHDELGKAKEALEYQRKHLAGNNELYIAASDQMDIPKRNIWKALIAAAKKGEADRIAGATGRKF